MALNVLCKLSFLVGVPVGVIALKNVYVGPRHGLTFDIRF